MSRLHQNFVFGTLADNLLGNSSGDTTMNSTKLAAMVAVGSPDVMAVTLDPQSQYGAPEIVWVTAHTSSATTATVLRGQEGTSVRAHSASEFWGAGPTALDFGVAVAPTWTSYTPTWSADIGAVALGNGTLSGSYLLAGKTCFVTIYLAFGTTTTGGQGRWKFALPPGVTVSSIAQNIVCQSATIGGGGQLWSGVGSLPAGSAYCYPMLPINASPGPRIDSNFVQNTDAGGNVGHGIPNTGANFPYQTGANLMLSGVFQTA